MCFTADPLLNTIGRGCIRGRVLFGGLFVFNYGLIYSVIA
jgi:hypothetical protein